VNQFFSYRLSSYASARRNFETAILFTPLVTFEEFSRLQRKLAGALGFSFSTILAGVVV